MFDIPAIYDPNNPNNTTTISQWVHNVHQTLIQLQQAPMPSNEQMRSAVEPVVTELRIEFDWLAEALNRFMDQDPSAANVTPPSEAASMSLDDLIQAGTEDRIAFPRDVGTEIIENVNTLLDHPADLSEAISEAIFVVARAFWRRGWAQGSTYVYKHLTGPEAEPV